MSALEKKEVQSAEQDHLDEVGEPIKEEVNVADDDNKLLGDCVVEDYNKDNDNKNEVKKHLDDEDGEAPLLCAIRGKNIQLVKQLLEGGVDVYVLNEHGLNSLHMAAMVGDLEMVELLLNHTPNLLDIGKSDTTHDSSQLGFTALHYSAFHNHKTVIEVLLKRGANVNAIATGYTPLHVAVYQGYSVIVKLLLNNGADINAVDAVGRTALDMAVCFQSNDIVRCLLDYKCNVNASNRTALHLADNTSYITFEWLLDAGIDIDSVDEAGNTVLVHVLCNRGSYSIFKLLLSRRPKVLVRARDQSTFLYSAGRYRDSELIELVLDQHLDKNAMTIKSVTALETAWIFDNDKGFVCLLNNDCDLNVSTKHFTSLVTHVMWLMRLDEKFSSITGDFSSTIGDLRRLLTLYKPLYEHGKRLLAIGRSISPVYSKLMKLKPKNEIESGTINFEEECKNEVQQLKQLQFGDSRWTFYDALVWDSEEQLLRCLSHISYERIVRMARRLPMYGHMLVCRFRNVSKRKQLLDRINEKWRRSHTIFSQLPWECLDLVAKHLSNQDLEAFNNCLSLED